MSQTDTVQHLQREMYLQQAIDASQDELVQLAARSVSLLKDNTAMETSQLRNLLNVSLETISSDVVVNFICYQIARNKGAWGQETDGFGHQVIKTIQNELPRIARGVTDRIPETVQGNEREILQADAQARLVRLYLGYLHRWFYFLNKSKDETAAVGLMGHLAGSNAPQQQTGGGA